MTSSKDKKKKSEEEKNVSLPEKEFKALEDKAKEFEDKYWRTLADLENTRKRLQKEKQDHTKFIIKDVILSFLPPLEHLEKALGFTEHMSEEVKNWAIGFTMILDQFKEVLHQQNITIFHAHGTTFDPHIHEALEIVETEENSDGHILEEFSPGYKMGDVVIKAACVKVAKRPSPQQETTAEPTEEQKEDEQQNVTEEEK